MPFTGRDYATICTLEGVHGKGHASGCTETLWEAWQQVGKLGGRLVFTDCAHAVQSWSSVAFKNTVPTGIVTFARVAMRFERWSRGTDSRRKWCGLKPLASVLSLPALRTPVPAWAVLQCAQSLPRAVCPGGQPPYLFSLRAPTVRNHQVCPFSFQQIGTREAQLRKRRKSLPLPIQMLLLHEYYLVVPRLRMSFHCESWKYLKDLRGELIHKWRSDNDKITWILNVRD